MSNEMNELRNVRNKMLSDSDWTVMPDSPLSDSKQTEWKTYRQALRDLPKGASPKVKGIMLDMSSVTFPTKPS
tara:strand:+ start:562 stop:780 length:219 start_codon:yes stop_codon:yes gene_type:complete